MPCYSDVAMAHAINLFDPEVRRDPYPTYAALREQPVQQVEPMGVWAISRYDDVQYALKHPELFSSAAFSAIFRPAWLPNNPLGNSLLVKDGPEHAKLRALINRAFMPKNIARFEPRIGEIAAGSSPTPCVATRSSTSSPRSRCRCTAGRRHRQRPARGRDRRRAAQPRRHPLVPVHPAAGRVRDHASPAGQLDAQLPRDRRVRTTARGSVGGAWLHRGGAAP